MRLICLFVCLFVYVVQLSADKQPFFPSLLLFFSLQDKCIDFVTTSSRTGTKSVRDLFKFAAQMTVMSTAEKRRNVLVTNDAKNQVGEGGKMTKNGGKIYEDDEAPAPQSHVNDRAAYIRRNGDAFGNLYTTME